MPTDQDIVLTVKCQEFKCRDVSVTIRTHEPLPWTNIRGETGEAPGQKTVRFDILGLTAGDLQRFFDAAGAETDMDVRREQFGYRLVGAWLHHPSIYGETADIPGGAYDILPILQEVTDAD